MIAKIVKGTSFSGVLAYVLGKQEGKARVSMQKELGGMLRLTR